MSLGTRMVRTVRATALRLTYRDFEYLKPVEVALTPLMDRTSISPYEVCDWVGDVGRSMLAPAAADVLPPTASGRSLPVSRADEPDASVCW
eukprot:jgi/Hompol1/5008/HPOL_000670-RA